MKQIFLLNRETALRTLWSKIVGMNDEALAEVLGDMPEGKNKEFKIVSKEEIEANDKKVNKYKVIRSDKEF